MSTSVKWGEDTSLSLAWVPHILPCGPHILWSLQDFSLLLCLDLWGYSFRGVDSPWLAPGHDCGSCRFLPKPQILLFLLGTLFSPLSLFTELCKSQQVLEPQRKVVSEPEIWTERGPAITHALTFSE